MLSNKGQPSGGDPPTLPMCAHGSKMSPGKELFFAAVALKGGGHQRKN